MQNRRIIDRLTSRIGLTVHPAIVSNSFLGVCAHVRQGGWARIVAHRFFHVLGQQPDIVAIDKIGRASWWERVGQYVTISVGEEEVTKKKLTIQEHNKENN